MKTLLTLILIVAVGFAAYWFFTKEEPLTMKKAQEEMAKGARKLGDAIEEIDTDKVKEELARTGKVVREKADRLGEAVKDVSADARVTTAVKAKLVADPDLSALTISANTTDGVVTLSGTVSSHENISKAIRLAMETEGVQKVISTLQVK
jgi:hyperosmotically inducible protein